MKRAEWLRPFSFGNAIDSRPFSLGSVIGFSSILTMESARDDWLLVHSHNGERSRRLASRPFSQWRARSAIGRGETDDPAPGSATETDITVIYEYSSRTFMKNKYGANILFL